MDTKLIFAEKYNWWTKDTSNISESTKLSYVLQKGTSEELFYVFKNFDISSLNMAFGKIKDDAYLNSRRKSAITQLMKYKDTKEI